MGYSSKYPNSLENYRNKEYCLYSLSIDIATFIGKLSVAVGDERGRLSKVIRALTKRLERLLIDFQNTPRDGRG